MNGQRRNIPDPFALAEELPSHREEAVRSAPAVGPAKYVLVGLIFGLVFGLPSLALMPGNVASYPRIQRVMEPASPLSWARRAMPEQELARELGITLEALYTTETTLYAYAKWMDRNGGAPAGEPLVRVPVAGATLEVGRAFPWGMLAGMLLGLAMYSRSRAVQRAEQLEEEKLRRESLIAREHARFTEMSRMVRQLNEMQAKLVSAEKLASIGRMSATLAHEIRNPLTIIASSAGMVAEDVPEGSNIREAMDLIRQEIERLNRIITDLLNFARPKPPRIEPHPLNQLMQNWTTTLGEELARRNIALHTRLDPAVGDALLDVDQLYQVLLNVVWNARDALADGSGGRVDVETRLDVVGTVLIVVRDNGPGIPPDVLEQIGEPFYTTKTQGTGLGIALCKQLMEGMGGSFNIESVLEEGAAVSLRLRAA